MHSRAQQAFVPEEMLEGELGVEDEGDMEVRASEAAILACWLCWQVLNVWLVLCVGVCRFLLPLF